MRFRLVHATARQRALDAVRDAPDEYVVTVKPPTRSLSQNAAFHALCSDLEGREWGGVKRDKDEWKTLLVSAHAVATGRQSEVIRGLEGELVNLRESTASMSKERSSSLIEYARAFVAQLEQA